MKELVKVVAIEKEKKKKEKSTKRKTFKKYWQQKINEKKKINEK